MLTCTGYFGKHNAYFGFKMMSKIDMRFLRDCNICGRKNAWIWRDCVAHLCDHIAWGKCYNCGCMGTDEDIAMQYLV